jgi:thiol-disulfide isomerase/thioredoxin
MKNKLSLILISASFGAAALAQAPASAPTLPTFSLKAARGGQTWTEKTLAAKPTLVFLFSLGCPHNAKAAPQLNRLAKTLAPNMRVVGFVNAGGDEASTYQEAIGLDFPLITDPKGKTIEALGGKHSLDFFALAGRGQRKAVGFWEGYSQKWVKEALTRSKVKVADSKLAFLPVGRQSGCGF